MAKLTHRPGNLPAEATTFVGRRRELAELKRTLATARLLTLVGPGGVGKTRLAVRAATDLARGFRDGAWLVELAELQDPSRVSNAVLSSMDLTDQAPGEPQARLLSYLREKELLLVIDNCEHLLDASASIVSQIIKRSPGVRMIATTRQPLSVDGEYVLPVPPLDLPGDDPGEPLARIRQNETVMLFCERAAAASGGFELSESNRAIVTEICRRLDGLPLAIELAAVRTRVLSPIQILDRLTDRFGLLSAGSRAALPRHQTLRTTIDWSYHLLDLVEQALFRRLGVFAAGFTVPGVEAICAHGEVVAPQVIDVLSSLVDKSLVVIEGGDLTARYRLHETMREYALVKLREAGEEAAARAAYAAYYSSAAVSSFEDARSRLPEWLDWVDIEMDNIRALLRRFQEEGDYASGTALAGSLGWYWVTRASNEGIRWLDEFVSVPQGEPAALAQAYFIRGLLSMMQVDPAASLPALEKALKLAGDTGDIRMQAQTVSIASIARNMAGDHEGATMLVAQGARLVKGLADRAAFLAVAQAEGFNAFVDGDIERARSVYSKAAEISRTINDLYSLEYCLMDVGFACLIAGDTKASKPFFGEAFSIARRIDDRIGQFYLLDALACEAAGAGQLTRAANLRGAADQTRIDAGASVNLLLAPLIGQADATVVEGLGAPGFEAEVKAGRSLSREEAAALAMETAVEPTPGVAVEADGGGLGRRELDVARLVATGLSNKEIGARLFISERTVESHVRGIMNKLGFNSRAQIASWVARI